MGDFTLGQHVRMTGTVRKVRAGFGRARTEYVAAPLPGTGHYGDDRTFADGVIVGKRTVVTGRTHYSHNEPPCFVADPGSARTVWLVAFHLNRKPAMCWTDQIVATEGGDDRG